MNILLIEDNEGIIKGLKYALEINNYKCYVVKSFYEAIDYLDSMKDISLIILDIMLPDGNGFNLYNKYIKKVSIPTIILTARDNEEDICHGLDLGAEDYLTKPFSTKELLSRIKRVLLRYNNNSIIKIDDITFDMDKMMVYKNDKQVDLTSLELKLLQLLFLNINKVITRSVILDKIWEITGNDVDDHTVTVYLKRIREKLDSDIIKTVKGIGYRIDEE